MMATETKGAEITRDRLYYRKKYGKGAHHYHAYVNTIRAYVEGQMEPKDDEHYGECFFTHLQLDVLHDENRKPR